MSLRTVLKGALCAVVAIQLGAAGAYAYEIVPDEELEQARGGVLLAGNVAFEFGAVVRTFENGALSLQTSMNWTPDGMQIDRTLGDGVTQLSDVELANAAGLGDLFRTAGGTVVAHSGADGQLMNMLLNTQSDQSLRQEMEITLRLPGFEGDQAAMVRQITGLRIADDLAGSAVASLRD